MKTFVRSHLESRRRSMRAAFAGAVEAIGLTLRSPSPGALVLALAVVQVIAWTLAPAVVHTAPPVDVVESALWGREGIILSDKHPNLPGLLMEAAYRLTGAYGWPDFLLSEIAIAVTFAFVYRLGRDLVGPPAAAAGTLLLAGCFYFSWPTPEFNHNVVQMPVWAAIAFVLWRAVERNTLSIWLIAGLLAAFGMYAKFSTGVLLLAGGVWMLSDRRGRACLATYRPWLGLLVLAAGLTPLAIELQRLAYGPLIYAESGSVTTPGLWSFLGAQVADCAAMLVIVGLAFAWREPVGVTAESVIPEPASADPNRAAAFLAIVGLGPIMITAGVALAHGAKDMWGAPMLNLVGLLIMLPLRHRLDRQALGRIATAAFALVIAVPLVYAGTVVAQSHWGGPAPPRPLWPGAEISARMTGVWRAATNAPLKIVGGGAWVAGLVALDAPDRPSIFTDFDRRRAPWITNKRLAEQGMLAVWEDREPGPPARLANAAGSKQGVELFTWSPSANAQPLKLHFMIIPPT